MPSEDWQQPVDSATLDIATCNCRGSVRSIHFAFVLESMRGAVAGDDFGWPQRPLATAIDDGQCVVAKSLNDKEEHRLLYLLRCAAVVADGAVGSFDADEMLPFHRVGADATKSLHCPRLVCAAV